MIFRIQSTTEELMDAVCVGLTPAQRSALVGSLLKMNPAADVVLIDAHERTVQSLIKRTPPLVKEESRRRFLNKLGLDVARHLYAQQLRKEGEA